MTTKTYKINTVSVMPISLVEKLDADVAAQVAEGVDTSRSGLIAQIVSDYYKGKDESNGSS